VPGADLIGPHGSNHAQAPVLGTGDEVHQDVQGGLVRPLQVIDDQDYGALNADPRKPLIKQ
jgi:hypothetical protein